MSDSLAEALYDDICRRATVPMDVWKDAPEFQRRTLESLAETARKYLATETSDDPTTT